MRRMGVEALEEAFTRYGLPGIVNADQGSQFTAGAFTEAVLGRGIGLSSEATSFVSIARTQENC
ncbi:hypothetical protein AWB66_05476 [Caballeronia telluris]|uniref:Uncharacterized protein n=1 Tax=Caballeronia telluris TaxID=326475 RepID=A0A158K6N5_9BURK|nr:hypothetical protein AWB66_05476 [Caballeronia telluris]